jgi:hypothetical protein
LPTRSSAAFALLALIAVALGFYAVGLLTGAVTLVGYASATKAQSGAVSTSTWSMSFGVPVVWLGAQQAIRADFDVDARFGAVTLTVAPPLPLRTSLQAATAYVEGTRTGSVVFVAEAPGWYTFSAEPSPLGGPRCGTPGLSLRNMLAGNPDCPVYDVRYSVTWHLAQGQAHAVARVSVPRPNGQLAVVRIRD